MKNFTNSTLKIYWQHTSKHKLLMFLTLFAVAGGALVSVIVPLYLKKFFDLISQSSSPDIASLLVATLLSILGVELIGWLCWRVASFAAGYLQSGVMAELSDTVFKYLHHHSLSFFSDNFIGSLVKKANRFIYSYERLSDRLFWNLLNLLISVSAIIFVLFTRSVLIGSALLIWVTVFIIVNIFLIKYRLKFDLVRSEAESAVSGDLADTLSNHTNVKLFNGYFREIGVFFGLCQKVKNLQRRVWNIENTFEAIQGLLAISIEIGLMYVGVRLWQKNQFTIGDFVLLQSYLLAVLMKIWDLGRLMRDVYHDLSDAEEMTEILNTPHEIQDVSRAKVLRVPRGGIKFENVDFNYKQTHSVLTGFNLDILPKEKIALVGPSGAGKTTVTKILLRLYDIQQGKISIDGQRIDKVTQESLWANLSLVPQDPILFHRSLKENIRYGRPEATDKEVYKAAKLAHCHEFISQFPEGYETFVGERGVKLSGGERQRVAIARAIIHNAPILVLDEATSSLDSESERLIQEALDNLMRDKTVIVIAHRLSTIMKMDRIILIDGGRIKEEGTHDELLEQAGGIYRKLWQLQAGGFIS
ncbi:MAG: ABC transporter ATP-binding protein [Candidatus Magasanikbacteria bacterium]|nr:ABC transporter ATP-binding protein [Candidatus Magasanikbacteria bacterium]